MLKILDTNWGPQSISFSCRGFSVAEFDGRNGRLFGTVHGVNLNQLISGGPTLYISIQCVKVCLMVCLVLRTICKPETHKYHLDKWSPQQLCLLVCNFHGSSRYESETPPNWSDVHHMSSSVQNPSLIPFNPGWFLIGIPLSDYLNHQCIG